MRRSLLIPLAVFPGIACGAFGATEDVKPTRSDGGATVTHPRADASVATDGAVSPSPTIEGGAPTGCAQAPFTERAIGLVGGYKRDLDRNRAAVAAVRRHLTLAGHDVTDVRILDLLIWSIRSS